MHRTKEKQLIAHNGVARLLAIIAITILFVHAARPSRNTSSVFGFYGGNLQKERVASDYIVETMSAVSIKSCVTFHRASHV